MTANAGGICVRVSPIVGQVARLQNRGEGGLGSKIETHDARQLGCGRGCGPVVDGSIHSVAGELNAETSRAAHIALFVGSAHRQSCRITAAVTFRDHVHRIRIEFKGTSPGEVLEGIGVAASVVAVLRELAQDRDFVEFSGLASRHEMDFDLLHVGREQHAVVGIDQLGGEGCTIRARELRPWIAGNGWRGARRAGRGKARVDDRHRQGCRDGGDGIVVAGRLGLDGHLASALGWVS